MPGPISSRLRNSGNAISRSVSAVSRSMARDTPASQRVRVPNRKGRSVTPTLRPPVESEAGHGAAPDLTGVFCNDAQWLLSGGDCPNADGVVWVTPVIVGVWDHPAVGRRT